LAHSEAGRVPNIDNLNFSAADIEYDDKLGINPKVYAAGDATLKLGHAQTVLP
jgi:pyruvate/2-oxoglutarate dehydrogenase complex dihydrolipoamide dehydrogenase (E3) component